MKKNLLVLLAVLSLLAFNNLAFSLNSINSTGSSSQVILADNQGMDIPTYNDNGDVIYGSGNNVMQKSNKDDSDPFLLDNEY